jgi:hypothetical protein
MLPNSKIKTSCKNCAFAVYDGKTQTNCLHKRIEKFGEELVEAYDDDAEFYVINRFCNYYRNKAWGYSASDIQKTESESAINISLLFDCDKLFKFESHDIIKFINDIQYYSNKINITLFHETHRDTGIKCFVSNIAREINKKTNISVCYNKNDFLNEQAIKHRSCFHSVINSLNMPSTNFAQKINNVINVDLKKAFTFEDTEVLFINNDVYKVLSRMDESKDYEDNVSRLVGHSKQLNNHIIL